MMDVQPNIVFILTDRDAWHGKLTKEQIDEGRRSYYALITHIDAQIGRFRQMLDKMDVGPTWFLFTSDHGEMLGDPNELHNLADVPSCNDRLLCWRARLIAELADRREDGLSDGRRLIAGKALPAVREPLIDVRI